MRYQQSRYKELVVFGYKKGFSPKTTQKSVVTSYKMDLDSLELLLKEKKTFSIISLSDSHISGHFVEETPVTQTNKFRIQYLQDSLKLL